MIKYNRFFVLLVVFFSYYLYPISSFGQGRVTRPKTKQKVTYHRIDQLNNEVAYRAIGSNGMYGVVDRNDKLILPCKYVWVNPFYEARSYVRLKTDGKCAIIDEKGRFVTDYIYDVVWSTCNESRICVGIKDEQRPGYFKFGIIDEDGNIILPLIYGMPNDSNGQYKDGKVKLSLNGKDVCFDRYGNEITSDVSTKKRKPTFEDVYLP